MIFKIFKDNQLMGDVSIERKDGQWQSDKPIDNQELALLVGKASLEKLPLSRDIFDQLHKRRIFIEELIDRKNEFFPWALKQFLDDRGYTVMEVHPEIDLAIQEKLTLIADDDPDKKLILERLPAMSYLEKTLVLKYL